MSQEASYSEPDGPTLLSVGAAAGRLGVAPATVRSWERRYGLGPGGRSSGGHRRYTEADLDRLQRMQELVSRGHTPAAAARTVLGQHSEHAAAPIRTGGVLAGGRSVRVGSQTRVKHGGGPGGRVLAVPGASPEVRGLARAASRLDADAAASQLGDLLVERGAVRTWNEVLRPLLASIGMRWVRAGVDVEHVFTEAIMDALRGYRAFLPRPMPGRPVLLACAPDEQHTLPLHALAAALAELRTPVRVLGGRVPTDALVSAARRTGAGAVFLWRHSEEGLPPLSQAELEQIGSLTRSRPTRRLVVGGLAWQGTVLPGTSHAGDLETAVQLLRPAVR
ncbi:MerR family transcriptional regulator [Jatrophihabitans sp.]|uniref:MerR family transcriptional regulator n=1 Tax=Jatrophihabitans sp. TaxID=1932789 RepID=UPI002CC8F297|nr:MerR family transcriptional regulator [Jatrophihabitans sp.]